MPCTYNNDANLFAKPQNASNEMCLVLVTVI